ncbi:MAG: EVE domain-containing protein [Proteobacteria bacterium]|nr:EVE domain-containing protein [Pseudomonadota bacterium]
MANWLMKSEPSVFSIDDLKAKPKQTWYWDGVRNYQARNYMRDAMKKGDKVFFYHSSCPQPGIVGIARVAREAYPDHTAFDPQDPHYDAKSDPANPTWIMVDVKCVRKLKRTIGLDELKAEPALEDFVLLRRGNRLSIMPVSEAQWNVVLGLE